MIKLDDLIESVNELGTFTPKAPFSPVVGERFKKELLELLTEIQFDIKSKETNDVSKIQLDAKGNYINHLQNKIEYLEDFIVRIARESKDL